MQSIESDSLAIDRKARTYIPFEDLENRPVLERLADFEGRLPDSQRYSLGDVVD